MNIYKVLSLISGTMVVLALIPYIVAIIKGRSRPKQASWMIWVFLNTTTLIGMALRGAILNSQFVVSVVGQWIVVILLFKFGTKNWNKQDKWCVVGGVFGIILSIIFKSPIVAITICQLVNFLGSIPTFVSVWRDYRNENRLAWMTIWLSIFPALVVAFQQPTVQTLAQPINFFLINSIMVYLIFIRKNIPATAQI